MFGVPAAAGVSAIAGVLAVAGVPAVAGIPVVAGVPAIAGVLPVFYGSPFTTSIKSQKWINHDFLKKKTA